MFIRDFIHEAPEGAFHPAWVREAFETWWKFDNWEVSLIGA